MEKTIAPEGLTAAVVTIVAFILSLDGEALIGALPVGLFMLSAPLLSTCTSRFATFRHANGTVAYLSDISAMRSAMHVDSNGFLKSASPVLKLFNDRIEASDQFPEEPIFERIGEGTYKISNTLGLAQEGWAYEKPRGSDGNPYFRVLVKKTEDGCIISVHDEYDSIEEATITDIDGNTRKINKVVKVLSQARDIKPHERWIDLRFHEELHEETEPSEVVQ